VQRPDGRTRQRTVTVGIENDGRVEITDGLSQGDVILLEKPTD